MAIYSGKIHYKWWFSIAMLNYQRVLIVTDSYWSLIVKILDPYDWLLLSHCITSVLDLRLQYMTVMCIRIKYHVIGMIMIVGTSYNS